MANRAQQPRYQQVSATARRMLALGESGRYEFKRDAEAVTVALLAALANWVAVGPGREVAHLLVGVDEVEDKTTGLVRGIPSGLAKGLDKGVARIQDLASLTRPIPVDAFIVEEGVGHPTPFIRVEVRPTMPPHFDDQGRRQTRQGRSTRALTDDELLRIYLDREAGSFAARFRQTSEELRSAVGAVGNQVDEIADGIEKHIAGPIDRLTITTMEAASAAESASSSADSAASSADSVAYEVDDVKRVVRDLQELAGDLHDDSTQNLALRVVAVRRKVWWAFTVDTWEHKSKSAERLERRLHELLSAVVALEPARNSWEVAVWTDLLRDRTTERRQRGTQKWWDAAIREVSRFMVAPAYTAPELPDLRAALQEDLDREVDDPKSTTNRFCELLTGP